MALRNKFLKIARQLYKNIAMDRYVRFHYSQLGEDAVLAYIFPKEYKGFYVDIGAYHPLSISNTALLHQRGWRGVNVDVSEQSIREFNKTRPHDTNINRAVSNKAETVTLFKFAEGLSPYNTIFADSAANNPGRPTSENRVETIDINTLLADNLPKSGQFDLLNLDTEGMDESLILRIDFDKFKPMVICVEFPVVNFDTLPADKIYCKLKLEGYELVAVCVATGIFRHKSLAQKLKDCSAAG